MIDHTIVPITDNSEVENNKVAENQSADETQLEKEARQPMTRRKFLRGLATGASAVAAAACWGDTSVTPTPRPFPTYTPTGQPFSPISPLSTPITGGSQIFLPLVENGGEVEVAIAPTNTPTPAPPPPTPTPESTPFPGGPPSKLGLFTARNSPQFFELVATQAVTVVKTLELDAGFVAQIKTTSPRTLVIGRIDLPQIDWISIDPKGLAREFVDRLMPIADDAARRPYFDGWEAYNEPVAQSVEAMKRLGEFEAERTRLLAERGIRSVVGNFATGTPDDLNLWPHFFPALRAVKEHNGWLGLHEYGAPTIYFMSTRDNSGRYPGVSPEDSGWHTLRYRKVYNEILQPAGLVVPLIFTEIGVDGHVQNNRPGPPDARGWQDFQQYWMENGYGLWGPGAYVEQLVWYDTAMRQNDYVVGGCIFAIAASAGWERYDILGPAAGVLQQYLSVHAPV